MSKYHYSVELKQNMYKDSKDYLKPFGFTIVDTLANKNVKSYLLHEWRMIYCWPFSKKTRIWLEKVAKDNGC